MDTMWQRQAQWWWWRDERICMWMGRTWGFNTVIDIKSLSKKSLNRKIAWLSKTFWIMYYTSLCPVNLIYMYIYIYISNTWAFAQFLGKLNITESNSKERITFGKFWIIIYFMENSLIEFEYLHYQDYLLTEYWSVLSLKIHS